MVAQVTTPIQVSVEPEQKEVDDLDNPFGVIWHTTEWAAKLATQELSRSWRNDAREGRPTAELVSNIDAVINFLEDFKTSVIESHMHKVDIFIPMDAQKRKTWNILMIDSTPFKGLSLLTGEPVAPEVPGGREIIDRVIVDLEDYEIHLDLFNTKMGPMAQIILWWKVDDEFEADSTPAIVEIKGEYKLMGGNAVFTIALG